MIQFTCECGRRLQAPESSAGRQVACPSCGQQQIVPAAREDAIRPTSTEQVREERRPKLSTNFDEDAPSEMPPGASKKAVTSLVLGILSLFCNVLTGVPAVILALLAFGDIKRSRGQLSGHGLAIAGLASAGVGTVISCVIALALLLMLGVGKVREAAQRVQSQNNLMQMALAMQNYHDLNGRFPAAAICDRNGKPLLSWRVALLPYLEQQTLYQQFKLDEPWNSPNNIKLLPLMPPVFQSAAVQTPQGETIYRVFVGNGAAFEQKRGLGIADFTDGLANTILIVEANQSVPWTKPDELPYNPNQPLPPLGGSGAKYFLAVAGDGAAHLIPKNTPEQTLRQLITRNDGQLVSFPPPSQITRAPATQ